MPGGVDGPAGLALLEGTLRGHAGAGGEGAPSSAAGGSVVRVHAHPTWAPPRVEGAEGAEGAVADPRRMPSDSRRRCIREATTERVLLVCVRRRRPQTTRGPKLPRALGTGHRVHHPARRVGARARDGAPRRAERAGGAFLDGCFQRERVPSAGAAAGTRLDGDGTSRTRRTQGRGRLDYCELVVWPETAGRIWDRIKMHMPAGAGRVNARMRFFRYGPDTIYRRHVDGELAGRAAHRGGRVRHRREQGHPAIQAHAAVLPVGGVSRRKHDVLHVNAGSPGVDIGEGGAEEGCALCFPHGDAEDSPVHEGSAVGVGPNGVRHKA